MNKIKLHEFIWNELERLHIVTTAGNVMSLTEAILELEAAQHSWAEGSTRRIMKIVLTIAQDVTVGQVEQYRQQLEKLNLYGVTCVTIESAQQSAQPTGGTCAACKEVNVVFDGCCINCGVPATSG